MAATMHKAQYHALMYTTVLVGAVSVLRITESRQFMANLTN